MATKTQQQDSPQAEQPKADTPEVSPEVFPKVLERTVRADGSVYTKTLLAGGTIVEHH